MSYEIHRSNSCGWVLDYSSFFDANAQTDKDRDIPEYISI
jgi:hypothetical protein